MHVSIDGRPAVQVDATAEEVRQLVVQAAYAAVDSGADPDNDAPGFMRAWDEQIGQSIRRRNHAQGAQQD